MQQSHASGPDALRATVLRRKDAVDSLRECWESIARQSPKSTPWQHWSFVSSWSRLASAAPANDSADWRVVVVADRRGPCLLVPLQLSRRHFAGMRWLEPIGMPDNIHRPRFGLGAMNPAAYAVALDAIDGLWGEADGLRIDEKSADDEELALLRKLATPRGWRFRSVPLHACPYLNLPASWPEYLNSRSPKLRKNLNSSKRRLSAQGTLRLASFVSAEEIAQGFDLLLDIVSRSWKTSEKIGLGASAHYREFYREFVASMAERGCARVYCLFSGENAIAATLALIDGDTYYSTQIAHDSRFDQYSPGTLLEAMELETLIQGGSFKIFDFLGAALANKRRWTDSMESTDRVMWLGPTPRAALFDTVYFRIKPFLKSARSQIRRWLPHRGTASRRVNTEVT